MSIQNNCCCTGHRKIAPEKQSMVQELLQKELEAAINDGYTRFISGFAEGVDLLFARLVINLQSSGKEITLEAAIPYRNRVKSPNAEFKELLSKCSVIGVVSEEYSKDCFMLRNTHMVQLSSRVIAVYDGREDGGTVFTMRYANVMERDLRVIRI